MKKVFYYLMLTSTIISGFAFIYELIHIGEANSFKLVIALFFECTISGTITILLEDRPRDTEYQRRMDDTVKNQGFGILILLFVLVMVALMAS